MMALDLHRYTPEQRQALAEDPTTARTLLSQLAKDSLSWVRLSVASNPSTPAKTLAELVHDGDTMLRLLVAENPSAPADLLEELALVDTPEVMDAVMLHPHTPDQLRVSLA